MRRTSTDAEWLNTGKLNVDADGIPLDLSHPIRIENSVGTRIMTGNTMIHGDTGWRRIDSLVPAMTRGALYLRRENHRSFLRFDYVEIPTGTTLTVPAGWWPGQTGAWPIPNADTDKIGRLNHRLSVVTFNFTGTAVGIVEAPFTTIPTAWPTSLLGIPS